MNPIYLDYNATTPIASEVLEEMMPYLKGHFGNPSSTHSLGIEAKKAVSLARDRVAGLINCNSDEIIFTSGGSESNNYAIKGAVYANRSKGNHIVTSVIEHPAVLEVVSYLENEGCSVSRVSVDSYGVVDIEELKSCVKEETVLVSIMHSNNEVGTIEPIQEIADIASQKGIVIHTDAAQSVGKVQVDVKNLKVDLLSIAGHKLYAPKGVGALYIKRGLRLSKLMHGASHEMNHRAGTENVPYIVALGKACEIAKRDIEKNCLKLTETRDLLYAELKKRIDGIELNGHPEKRLPNTLNLSFKGASASLLLSELTDIAVSPGAACHSDNSQEVSYVLREMGVSQDLGLNTIRFSTGRETTKDEIITAAEIISESIKRLSGAKMANTFSNDKVQLTKYTHGLGCACKIKPNVLNEVLKKFSPMKDKRVITDYAGAEDAAVYKIDKDKALVTTVDFFTPIVDNPYDFGAIAAANSLSDIYAMGAKPLFALNIAGFPSKRLPLEILEQILRGANDKACEAGIAIVGGHTIEDNEPKFGLAVTGMVHPEKVIRNSNAEPDDILVLTKPLGTGILATAVKRGFADKQSIVTLTESMSQLNSRASSAMVECGASGCTDITGFGLLGHAYEMAKASGVDIEIESARVPYLKNVHKYLQMDAVPGGSMSNLEYFGNYVDWENFS